MYGALPQTTTLLSLLLLLLSRCSVQALICAETRQNGSAALVACATCDFCEVAKQVAPREGQAHEPDEPRKMFKRHQSNDEELLASLMLEDNPEVEHINGLLGLSEGGLYSVLSVCLIEEYRIERKEVLIRCMCKQDGCNARTQYLSYVDQLEKEFVV